MPEIDFFSSQMASQGERSLGARVRDWASLAAVQTAIFLLFLFGLVLEDPLHVVAFLVAMGLLIWGLSRIEGLWGWFQALVARNRLAAMALLAVFPLVYPFVFLDNPYLIHVGTLAAIFTIIALGLNIALGFCGLLDVGYSVYFAAGAYTSSQLAVHFDVPFWIGLPLGGLAGALFGFVVAWPALRAHGHYLALVTLGYGLMMNLLHRNFTWLTNGTDGVISIPPPAIGGFDFFQKITIAGTQLPYQLNFYFLALVFAVLAVAVSIRLRDSNMGRQWEALREDEVAAKCFGVREVKLKVIAFSTGAFFGGIGGALFAHTISFVHPDNFVLLTSITILAMVIVGGMGNVFGVVIGAVLLTFIPERLRDFESLRMLLFGSSLVLIMIYRPQGLFPAERRRRELQADAVQTLIDESDKAATAKAALAGRARTAD